MSLKDSFNASNYGLQKVSGNTLRLSSDNIYYTYDFGTRLMTARYGQALSTQPFSQIDRETLVELRDKLIEMGGTPPELPPEEQTGPQKPRALNP